MNPTDWLGVTGFGAALGTLWRHSRSYEAEKKREYEIRALIVRLHILAEERDLELIRAAEAVRCELANAEGDRRYEERDEKQATAIEHLLDRHTALSAARAACCILESRYPEICHLARTAGVDPGALWLGYLDRVIVSCDALGRPEDQELGERLRIIRHHTRPLTTEERYPLPDDELPDDDDTDLDAGIDDDDGDGSDDSDDNDDSDGNDDSNGNNFSGRGDCDGGEP